MTVLEVSEGKEMKVRERASLPTIFTPGTLEERPLQPGVRRRTVFSSIADLAPGAHLFHLEVGSPCRLAILVDSQLEAEALPSGGERILRFTLEAERVNGALISIVKEEEGQSQSLMLLRSPPTGDAEVPPYRWFAPAAPADRLLEVAAGEDDEGWLEPAHERPSAELVLDGTPPA